jgi:hypothetical protein
MKKVYLFVLVFALVNMACLAQTKKFLAIGIGYKPMTSSGCASFKEAVAYYWVDAWKDDATLSAMREEIKEALTTRYGVDESDVMITTTDRYEYGVIIRYQKPMSSYNCVKTSYAVGYGNSQSEAEEKAIKEMRLYYSGDDYRVEKVVF